MNDEEKSRRKIEEISVEWEILEKQANTFFKNLTKVFRRIRNET